MTAACSKRAQNLVALGRAMPDYNICGIVKPSPVCSESSSATSTSPERWWDNVYEAADLILKGHSQPTYQGVSCVKRRLFLSPNKDLPSSDAKNNACELLSPSLLAETRGRISQKLRSVRSLNTSSNALTHQYVQLIESSQIEEPFQSAQGDSIPAVEVSSTHLPCFESTADYEVLISLEDELKPSAFSEQFSRNSPAHIICSNDTLVLELDAHSHEPENGLPSSKNIDEDNSVVTVNKDAPVKTLYPSQRRINETKLALNAGKEHISLSGKHRKPRALKRPCSDKCSRCARPRITEDERLHILTSFWNLGNHEQQWLFIFECIKLSVPKRKFAIQGAKGEKSVSRDYYFIIDGNKKKVCKTMFLSTLNICDSWINNAFSHCSDGHVKIPDKRGNHRHSKSS